MEGTQILTLAVENFWPKFLSFQSENFRVRTISLTRTQKCNVTRNFQRATFYISAEFESSTELGTSSYLAGRFYPQLEGLWETTWLLGTPTPPRDFPFGNSKLKIQW